MNVFDNLKSDDEETDSLRDDLPIDNPQLNNLAADQSKTDDSGTEKFSTDRYKTDNSKTDISKITPCAKVNKELTTRCRGYKFKTDTTDKAKTCNCTSKTDDSTPNQAKIDDSKTGTSKIKTYKVNKKRSSKISARKSKTGVTDNIAPDQSKIDDFTTDQFKTSTSKHKTNNNKPEKIARKQYKRKTKSFTSHKDEDKAEDEDEVIFIDDDEDDTPSPPITPADRHLPPVKYKLKEHPKTVKYKDSCLAGDYGTRIYAWGDSLKEAFEQCGMALYSYMVDLDTVEIHQRISIEVEADNLMILLYRFLDELSYIYCTPPHFHCKKLVITTFDSMRYGCFLDCDCFGEDIKQGKHSYGKQVEGTQFIDMQIIDDPDNKKFEIYCTINS